METRRDLVARRGLPLPKRTWRRLASVGIYARPEVSLEYQQLARRYVVRGVESGGAIASIGRYVTFAGESGERDVTADAGYCATRFHATHDIPSRQLLILETDLWPSVNPDRRQPTPSPFRQRQATPRHEITPCFHRPSLCGSSNRYREAQRNADHLLCASRPALVFPGFLDRDRQIVAASIEPSFGARWATRHVIPTDFPKIRYTF